METHDFFCISLLFKVMMLVVWEFMIHQKHFYMCTHVDSRTERCHRSCTFKDLWSPQVKLKSCIPGMPCFAPGWQLTLWEPLRLMEFPVLRKSWSVSWFHLRLKLHPVGLTILAPQCTSLLLQPSSTSAAGLLLCWGHDTRETLSITFHFSPMLTSDSWVLPQ